MSLFIFVSQAGVVLILLVFPSPLLDEDWDVHPAQVAGDFRPGTSYASATTSATLPPRPAPLPLYPLQKRASTVSLTSANIPPRPPSSTSQNTPSSLHRRGSAASLSSASKTLYRPPRVRTQSMPAQRLAVPNTTRELRSPKSVISGAQFFLASPERPGSMELAGEDAQEVRVYTPYKDECTRTPTLSTMKCGSVGEQAHREGMAWTQVRTRITQFGKAPTRV